MGRRDQVRAIYNGNWLQWCDSDASVWDETYTVLSCLVGCDPNISSSTSHSRKVALEHVSFSGSARGQGGLSRPATWHLPGGLVGPPTMWASASNVEGARHGSTWIPYLQRPASFSSKYCSWGRSASSQDWYEEPVRLWMWKCTGDLSPRGMSYTQPDTEHL